MIAHAPTYDCQRRGLLARHGCDVGYCHSVGKGRRASRHGDGHPRRVPATRRPYASWRLWLCGDVPEPLCHLLPNRPEIFLRIQNLYASTYETCYNGIGEARKTFRRATGTGRPRASGFPNHGRSQHPTMRYTHPMAAWGNASEGHFTFKRIHGIAARRQLFFSQSSKPIC